MQEPPSIAGHVLASSTVCICQPRLWPAVIAELGEMVHRADFWLSPEPEKPLTMAQVRELQQFAHATPVGERKIVCLTLGDQMRVEVANALLKLLEEPPAYLYTVILSESRHILPTIQSRMRCIDLAQGRGEESTEREKLAETLEAASPAYQRDLLYLSALVHPGVQQDVIREAYANTHE